VHPNYFAQGGQSTLNFCSPELYSIAYDSYEFYLSSPSTIIASLCPADGGASFITSPSLLIYQAPTGTRVNPFTPNGCQDAVTAYVKQCNPGEAYSASLSAGYFYV